jgi:DNA mismatch repair protein MutS
MDLGLIAAGAVLHYLRDTEHPNLQHVTSLQRIEQNDYLWMDKFTIRNLELLYSNVENGNTLLKVLDNTVTPMGARQLKRWIVFPLKDISKINERLEVVEHLILACHAAVRRYGAPGFQDTFKKDQSPRIAAAGKSPAAD